MAPSPFCSFLTYRFQPEMMTSACQARASRGEEPHPFGGRISSSCAVPGDRGGTASIARDVPGSPSAPPAPRAPEVLKPASTAPGILCRREGSRRRPATTALLPVVPRPRPPSSLRSRNCILSDALTSHTRGHSGRTPGSAWLTDTASISCPLPASVCRADPADTCWGDSGWTEPGRGVSGTPIRRAPLLGYVWVFRVSVVENRLATVRPGWP